MCLLKKMKYYLKVKMIVDSHCHLNYEPMYSSLKILSRAKNNNVDYLLTISTVDKDYEKLLSIINNGVYGIWYSSTRSKKS